MLWLAAVAVRGARRAAETGCLSFRWNWVSVYCEAVWKARLGDEAAFGSGLMRHRHQTEQANMVRDADLKSIVRLLLGLQLFW